MNCKWEMDTQVLIENCSPPSFLNDSSPLLWQKFEKKFKSEKAAGSVSKSTQFEYAWCLVRSKYNDDIRKGIALLQEWARCTGGGCRGVRDRVLPPTPPLG